MWKKSNLVDYGTFDTFYSDGLFIDTENTGTFAGSRTDTARELGEVVCQEKAIECIFPLIFEYEVIPLWDDIGNRATRIRLTERNAAVHATR